MFVLSLVETSSNPALKATDASTAASHDGDKQYKKAS